MKRGVFLKHSRVKKSIIAMIIVIAVTFIFPFSCFASSTRYISDYTVVNQIYYAYDKKDGQFIGTVSYFGNGGDDCQVSRPAATDHPEYYYDINGYHGTLNKFSGTFVGSWRIDDYEYLRDTHFYGWETVDCYAYVYSYIGHYYGYVTSD